MNMIPKGATPSKLHPRNKHRNGYQMEKLCKSNPALLAFVFTNDYGTQSIDFANPKAVFELNKALLVSEYKIKNWQISPNSLCPGIPGRADYIHYIADILAKDNNGQIPTGEKVKVLDIGTGSSIVYPLIGAQEYLWDFTATEIDPKSIQYAEINVNKNIWLKKKIQLRFQDDKEHILQGIIFEKDRFDAVVCNPPFFKSREDNWNVSSKKFQNLHKNKEQPTVQNFSGHPNELWYPGGEKAFISKLIYESIQFKDHLNWVTTLVSSKDHIKPLVAILEYHKAAAIEIIPMQQGQKVSRILAWKW
ncbi:MAG: 23S rRNA (adenine(1618)-N(6))-methyltransferase RlmF [Sphingobacterium sp.]|jgi:23S rRNA (adenine1618-N6)-methyltransferase|nr:23S rRNA (adenine(1618)-N(6))-methyltransferase RlmF [Sphingobacterium sp.]